MRAVVVREFGGPEVMHVEERPVPQPGPRQVLVRVRAAGVNPIDTYIRTGTHIRRPTLPYTPGFDGAGDVESVGAEVTAFRRGDRVYISPDTVSIGGAGSYAEYALCSIDEVQPLPSRLSYGQGAAIGVPYITAYRALFQRAAARPGETVLVHGATGGVGIPAVQLGKLYGLTVFGTGGSERGLELVRAHGADLVVDHTEQDYEKAIMDASGGRGVDVIVEMATHLNMNRDLGLIARSGRIIVVGNRAPTEINGRLVMSKDVSIIGMTLFNTPRPELASIHAALRAGFACGALNPVVGREMPLTEAGRAHEVIMERGALGKIILVG
jgi:NADPH2:quinone reductase